MAMLNGKKCSYADYCDVYMNGLCKKQKDKHCFVSAKDEKRSERLRKKLDRRQKSYAKPLSHDFCDGLLFCNSLRGKR